jgi:hypothetical protein
MTWGHVPPGSVIECSMGRQYCVFTQPNAVALVSVDGTRETIVFETSASTSGYKFAKWEGTN